MDWKSLESSLVTYIDESAKSIDWEALKQEARAKIKAEQDASGETKRFERLKAINACFCDWYNGALS